MKKLISVVLVFVLSLLSFTGCGGNTSDDSTIGDEQKVTIKIATVISGEDSPAIKGLKMFKTNIEEKSNGRITVQLFPSGQLGTERDAIDQVRNNDIQMTTVNPLGLNTTIKEFSALDQYFMFDNEAHAFRFFDSEGGQFILDALQHMDLQGLGYFPLGFRQFTNSSRAINSIDDLKGLKIRGYNPVQIAVWEAVGCNVSSVGWTELFTALQQNLIDGQEGAITSFSEAKFYEVQKYVSITNHMFSTDILVAGQKFLNSLSEEDAALINDELKVVFDWNHQEVVKQTNELKDSLASEYNTEFNEVSAETIEKMKEIMAPITKESIIEICGEETFDKVMEYVEETR